jgi:hypothetical protein
MNHIQSINDPEFSWCGEQILLTVFNFKTIDQAALNALFPDKKIACNHCIQKIIEALLTNTDVKSE